MMAQNEIETGTARTYHYVMSVAWNAPRGNAQATYRGLYEIDPGWQATEQDVFEKVLFSVKAQLGIKDDPTVLFYRLTPNRTL